MLPHGLSKANRVMLMFCKWPLANFRILVFSPDLPFSTKSTIQGTPSATQFEYSPNLWQNFRQMRHFCQNNHNQRGPFNIKFVIFAIFAKIAKFTIFKGLCHVIWIFVKTLAGVRHICHVRVIFIIVCCIVTWDQAQFEPFSYILSKGYRGRFAMPAGILFTKRNENRAWSQPAG